MLADELRRVMQTARRTFKCHVCNRTYAKQVWTSGTYFELCKWDDMQHASSQYAHIWDSIHFFSIVIQAHPYRHGCHTVIQDSLAVHMRLSHSGNPHEAGNKRISTFEIEKKLERSPEWMPRFKHVLPCTSTMNAVCGGINNLLGSFFVVGGADKRVTLRSLDAKMDMKILYSISCNSTVNAIAVSQNGRCDSAII